MHVIQTKKTYKNDNHEYVEEGLIYSRKSSVIHIFSCVFHEPHKQKRGEDESECCPSDFYAESTSAFPGNSEIRPHKYP